MTFEEIYAAYSPRVYRLCRGYVRDADWAADLTQEVFVAVWQHLAGFRGEAAISTWVFRIATNTCLRQVGREQRRATTPTAPEDFPANLAAEPPDPGPQERLDALYRAIGELAEADRLLIGLVLEAVPYPEIAAIVGISEGNVRVRLHRIKEKLTTRIASYGTV